MISAATLHLGAASAHDRTLPTGEVSLAHTLSAWAPVTWPPVDRMARPSVSRSCADRLDPIAVPAIGRETSRFGVRRDPLGGGWRLHAGIDLAAPFGSPVPSAAGGAVLRAGWTRGYGNMVIIDHGDGLTTRYAHLSRSLVRVGQDVDGGQPIGLVGATGHATGSHLHFEIRLGNRALDPETATETAVFACVDRPTFAPVLREVAAQSGWTGATGAGLNGASLAGGGLAGGGALPTAVIR